MSVRLEDQKETHFLKRRICVDELDQRHVLKIVGCNVNEPL